MSTQRKSVKQLTALISMSCLMVLILTSCRPPESKAAVNPLQLAQAKPNSPVAGIEVRGNLSFPNQQELYFSTTGTIEEISVKKGDQVNEGQLLARLDNTTQRLTVDSAQFDVSKAKNALAKRVCPTPGRTVYEFLNGPGVLDTLEAMQAELEKADVSVVNQEYDEVSEELSLAKDDLERAKRILLDSYIRIDSHGLDQATLIQLSLDLEKSRIALEKAKEELRKTEIYAPFGGIINDVPVKEGDVLSTVNYTTLPIVQLVDPNVIEVEGLLDEVDRCRAKIGDEADIMVDVLPDIKLKGEVNFISEVGTVRSGGVYYRVTINVEPPLSRELKHGMGATARIFPKRGP